jgi:hypothetical protein
MLCSSVHASYLTTEGLSSYARGEQGGTRKPPSRPGVAVGEAFKKVEDAFVHEEKEACSIW